MDYSVLLRSDLFQGTLETEAKTMLHCLGSSSRQYEKGQTIYQMGQHVEHIGLVLSGSVNVEHDGICGNKSILGHVEAGQIFAETYACIPSEPLMVSVIACEKTQVLFLNAARIVTTCPNSCAHHNKLIQNLLQIAAQKNLGLSRRILHTASKSIRGRLLSYLSEQVVRQGGNQFTIPFNRQQLADYLEVDRSALSNELSKMQREGMLTYHRNSFSLRNVIL